MITKIKNKASHWIIPIAFVVFILSGVHQLLIKEYYLFIVCIGSAALMFIPATSEKLINVTIPDYMQITLALYVFFSMIMGKVYNLYEIIPIWDKLLHILSGVILSIIALRLLNTYKVCDGIPPLLTGVIIFSFALAAGAVWEIYEYGLDVLFSLDAQRAATGVTDTMLDIICDAAGSLVFIIFIKINK